MGTVTEFHNGCDQADDQRCKQLVDIVVVRVVQVADEKAEVQCQGQDNEECEEDLLQVHVVKTSCCYRQQPAGRWG